MAVRDVRRGRTSAAPRRRTGPGPQAGETRARDPGHARRADAEKGQPAPATALAEQAAAAILGANPFVGIEPRVVAGEALVSMSRVAARPRRLAVEAGRLGADIGRALAGRGQRRPAEGDRRFADPAWSENPFYRRLLQGHLALVASAHRCVDAASLDAPATQRAHLGVSLLADALSPTNTLPGNPAALKRAFDTAGLSIARGARQFARDLRHNHGMPQMVDARRFQVGGNLALSPGAVVYRNEVLEVIQYQASTPTVFRRPLLVIPPQINKYYVLDLAPSRSFTAFAVAEGIPYFTISWRNPTAEQREWGLDVYVRACLDAVAVVSEISGDEPVNLVGLCAGGVTMSLLLGYIAAIGKAHRVASATLAVAMLDMDTPSMMSIFASDIVVAAALRRSRARGVLDGGEMARTFAWMRPNDLIWSYWVNNYLLGQDPSAYDILFWNSDTTRLPAQLHADFLDLYLRNPLPRRGGTTVLGTPIDLQQVTCPTYVVAGATDHIVPWKAAFRSTAIFGGASEFVLSSSGHVQAIVNPPGNPKAGYFTDGPLSDDPDRWLVGAVRNGGSWWEHWVRWVGRHSGPRIAAPSAPGSLDHPALDPAPGRYALQR